MSLEKWKGREERARKGPLPRGNTPYGFTRGNKDEIYSLAVEKSGHAIADDLNQKGYCRNGKPQTQRLVARILEREKLYREGVVRYGTIEGVNRRGVLLVHISIPY